jgi:hypothetical protein
MLQLFNNNNNKENSRDYFRERSNTSLLKRILFNKNIVSDNSIDKLERYNIIKTNENTITLLNKIDNDIYQIHNITLRKNDILRQIIDAFNNTDDDGLLSLLRRHLRDARTRAVRRASRGSNRRANVRANNRSSRTQTNQQRPSSNNTNPRQAQNNTTGTNRTQQTQQVPRAQQTPSSVQPPNTSQAPASRLPAASTAPTTAPTTSTAPSTTQVAPRPVTPTIPQSVTPPTASVTPPITPPISQAPTAPATPQVTTPQTTAPTQASRLPSNETIRQIAIRHASNGFNSILRILPFISAGIAGINEYQETQNESRAATVAAGHLGGLIAGAKLGATAGSIVPGVGTIIGGLAGGFLGSIFGEEFAKTVYDIIDEYGEDGIKAIKKMREIINDINSEVQNNNIASTLFSGLQQFFDSEGVRARAQENRIRAQEERIRLEIYELLRQGVNDGLIKKEQAQDVHDAMNRREFSFETIRNNLQNELERIRQEKIQEALRRNEERIAQNAEGNQRIQEVIINNLNDAINAINQYIDNPNERISFLSMARNRNTRLEDLIKNLNNYMSRINRNIRFTQNARLSTLSTSNSLLTLVSTNIINDDIEFDKFVKEQKKQNRIVEKEQEQRLYENDIINFLNNNTFNEITFEAEELFFDGNISALIELLVHIINENQVIKIPNQLILTQQNENPVATQTATEIEKVSQNNQISEVQRTYTLKSSTAQVSENNYNEQNINENEPNEMAELQQQPGQNNELTRENAQQFSEPNNQQINQNENQNINQNTNQNDFMAEVNRVSNRFGINPNDLLALMRSESSLNPQAVNPTTGATGLIQFMPKTARSLGTTVEELRNMSAAQQMRFIEKYFESVNLPRGASAGTLYAYVFLPGRAQRQILARAGENFYEANRGLDMNKDGIITIEDLDMRMARYGGTINRESTRMVANNQARLRRNDTNIIINTAQNTMPQENNQIIKNDNTMRREVSLLQRLEKLALVQA